MAHGLHRAALDSVVNGRHLGAPEGTHAGALDGNAVRVNFRLGPHPVQYSAAGVHPVGGGNVDAPLEGFLLAGAVNGQDGNAPFQQAITVQGHARFLEAVHAGNAHYAGKLAPVAVGGGLAVRHVGQVEPRGDGAVAEGNVHASDFVVGVLGIFGVTLHLLVAQTLVFRCVGEYGPLGAAVEQGRDEVAFSRGHQVPLGLVLAGLVLAANGGAPEFAAGVVEPFGAGADSVEVRGRFGTAGAQGVADSPLVPLDSHGLDNHVQQPALVLPALHSSLNGGFHSRHTSLPRCIESRQQL